MLSKPVEFLGDSLDQLREFPLSVRRDASFQLDKVEDAVYVLHCFQKKTQETSQQDMDIAKQRFKDLMRKQP